MKCTREIISPADVRSSRRVSQQSSRTPARCFFFEFQSDVANSGRWKTKESSTGTRFSGLSENFVSLGWKTPKEGRYLIATYKIFSSATVAYTRPRKWALSSGVLCRVANQRDNIPSAVKNSSNIYDRLVNLSRISLFCRIKLFSISINRLTDIEIIRKT